MTSNKRKCMERRQRKAEKTRRVRLQNKAERAAMAMLLDAEWDMSLQVFVKREKVPTERSTSWGPPWMGMDTKYTFFQRDGSQCSDYASKKLEESLLGHRRFELKPHDFSKSVFNAPITATEIREKLHNSMSYHKYLKNPEPDLDNYLADAMKYMMDSIKVMRPPMIKIPDDTV